MSFEKFLIERLWIDEGSRTSEGNLYCDQAKVYDKESKKYDCINYPGYVFRDLRDICRGRAVARDIASSLIFLRGGEDFAIRGLPDSLKDFTTNDFYNLFEGYLRSIKSKLVLDKDHQLRTPEGKLVGYCSITYSRCGKPKDHILLVTLDPDAWPSFEEERK